MIGLRTTTSSTVKMATIYSCQWCRRSYGGNPDSALFPDIFAAEAPSIALLAKEDATRQFQERSEVLAVKMK